MHSNKINAQMLDKNQSSILPYTNLKNVKETFYNVLYILSYIFHALRKSGLIAFILNQLYILYTNSMMQTLTFYDVTVSTQVHTINYVVICQ